ncbi:hypothetical protein ACVJMY_000611 [Bradyrhizobium diazoefficiens]
MSKLKLGTILDDKPVKIAVELPAAVHRNLLALCRGDRARERTAGTRSRQAHRSDDPKIHGNRQGVFKGETRGNKLIRGRSFSVALQKRPGRKPIKSNPVIDQHFAHVDAFR